MVVMFVIVVFVVNGTFRTIPTVESYGAGGFVPTRTDLAVKLFTKPKRPWLAPLEEVPCFRLGGSVLSPGCVHRTSNKAIN